MWRQWRQRRLVSLHVAAVEGVISVCGGIKKALPAGSIYYKCMSRINCVRYLFCLLLSCSKIWIDSNQWSPVSSLICLFLGQQICDETTPAASFSVPGFRMIEGKSLFINQRSAELSEEPSEVREKKKRLAKHTMNQSIPRSSWTHFGLGVQGLCYATCGFGGEGAAG